MPMNKNVLILSLFFCMISSIVLAIQYDTTGLHLLLRQNDKLNRIRGLQTLARYVYDVKMDYSVADSLGNEAVIESKLMNNKELIFHSVMLYADVCEMKNTIKEENYLQSLLLSESLDNNKKCNLYLQQCSMNVRFGYLDKSRENLQNAFNYIFENKENKIKYLLLLGDISLKKNEKLNAFENYNSAILSSKIIDNDSLSLIAYKKMVMFYCYINEWAKARNTIDKCFEIIKSNHKFNLYDSLLLQTDLLLIHTNSGENELALKIAENIYPYCIKYQLVYLKELVFGILRTGYLSQNQTKAMCDLYCFKYPGELMQLQKNDLKTYYKVQAFIHESNNMPDSAKYYLTLSESLINNNSNSASVASFYKRKGEFYLRQKDYETALNAFYVYFDFAKKSNYFPFIIDAAHQLDSLLIEKGKISDAYTFAKIATTYADSNARLLEKDKLISMEIENISRLNEIEQEKQALINSKRENFQVLLIILTIILSISLLVIISKFKISRVVLKTFSYLTFVLLFEFIIYLLDGYIHHWAHGQPILIMIVKVILIAILLPIHHATDYRVIQYLTRKNLVKEKSNVSMKNQILHAWTNFRNWLNIHPEHINNDEEITHH